MNTALISIGAAFAGMLLGAIGTALVLLPIINELTDAVRENTESVDDLSQAIDEQTQVDASFYAAAHKVRQ